MAVWTPCGRPTREPDFVSDGWDPSVYWNDGDAVIRDSNHWSGSRDIGDIGGCWWRLAGGFSGEGRAAGRCPFGAFSARPLVPIWHEITESDVQIARELHCCAVAASDWVVGAGRNTKSRPVPPWASRYTVSDGVFVADKIPAAAVRLRRQRPRVQAVIAAWPTTTRSILAGAKRVKVGLELGRC